MRDGRTKDMGSLFEQMFKELDLERKMMELKYISAWDACAEKSALNATEEIYLKGKKLFVKLNSSAVKYQLQFVKDELMDKLNKTVESNYIEQLILL